MNDKVKMSDTIAAKSNQLNADDLISGPRTITITKISGDKNKEQPIAINFQGDDGKPWYPCKTARRIIAHCWSDVVDNDQYAGRRVTLFRDATVTWGGMAVGGIRISHMSDIEREMTLSLNASNKSKKPFTVKPLAAEAGKVKPTLTDEEKAEKAESAKANLISGIGYMTHLDQIKEFPVLQAATLKRLHDGYFEKYEEVMEVYMAKERVLAAASTENAA